MTRILTAPTDKRALDRLMDAAANWNERGREDEDLVRGGELASSSGCAGSLTRCVALATGAEIPLDRSFVSSKAAELERQCQVETLSQTCPDAPSANLERQFSGRLFFWW